ncbi:MAG: hypothetical protein H0W84_15095 [Bacteroidetes bacterium]|nr:hypothetical protein [Bacteroidota bacterium]
MAALWPPGQALMIAAVFKLFGETAFPLKMLYLAVSTWALMLTCVYHSLEKIKKPVLKFSLCFLPFFFSVFQTWVFDDSLVLSENVSLPLFIIGFCFFIFWLQDKKWGYLIASAAIFAALAYFRGYFEVFGRFLALAMVIYLIILKIKSKKTILTPKVITMMSALLVFMMLLMPWRIYNSKHFGTYSWQPGMTVMWPFYWVPDSKSSFHGEAAENTACHIQPELCSYFYTRDLSLQPGGTLPSSFYRMLTLTALLEHPIAWYGVKAKAFNVFWFGEHNIPLSWNEILHRPIMLLGGVLIFLSGVFSLIYSAFLWFRKKLFLGQKELFVFSGSFIFFNFILFTFFHFEPRYSLYLQLLFIYLPLWLFFGFNENSQRDENL